MEIQKSAAKKLSAIKGCTVLKGIDPGIPGVRCKNHASYRNGMTSSWDSNSLFLSQLSPICCTNISHLLSQHLPFIALCNS